MAVDWSQFKPVSPTNAADAKPSAVDWSQFRPVEAPAAGPVASQLRTSANVDRTWGEAAIDTMTGIGQAGLSSISGVVRGLNDRAPGAAEAEREGGFVAGLLMDVGGKVYEAGLGAQRALGELAGNPYVINDANRGLQVLNARRAASAPEDAKRSDGAETFAGFLDERAARVPEVQSEKARLMASEMGQLTQAEGLGDQAFATIDYFASPFLRGDLSTGGARVSKVMESLIPSLAAGGAAAKAVGAVGAGAGIQTAAQLGTMSVMEGGGAAEGARGEVLNTPIEALQAAPEFQAALRMTGGDPIRARDLLADQAASISFGLGTGAAIGTMGLGQVFGANVAEQAVREGVGSLATGAGVRQALLGTAGAAGKEFASEFVQGASNQAAQNVGTFAAGANDNLGRGVVAAGIMEGIAGGTSGIAAQTAAEVSKRLRPIEDGEDLLGGSNVATGAPGAAEPGGLALPDDPAAEPITSAEVEALRQQQLSALQAKANGRPDQTVVDPVTGRPVTVRGEPKQVLSDAEKQILGFLQKYADRPDVLARALGRRLDDSATYGASADTTGASPQTSEAPNIGGAAPNISQPAPNIQPSAAAPVDADVILGPDPVAPAPVAPQSPAAQQQGVPTMITQAMKAQLRERGYTDANIRSMTPQQAWDAINAPAQPAPESQPAQPGPVASALRPQPADDLLVDQAAAELQGMDEETPPVAGPVAIDPQPEEVRNEEVQQVPDAQPAAGEVAQQGPQGQQEEVVPAPASAPPTGIVAGALAAQSQPADPDIVEGQLPAESTFAAAREREIPSEAPPPESFIPQVLSEIGWLQKGGYMIRDPETAIGASSQAEIDPERGDVTDRTKWIGKPAADGRESQFWRMRPNRNLSEEDAAGAVTKWRQGRKLGPRQQEFIDYMLKAARDYAEQWNTERAETMRAIVDLEAEGIVEERDQLRAAVRPDMSPEDEREALQLDDLLRRAAAAGATREQLLDILTSQPERQQAKTLWHFIKTQERDRGTDEERPDQAAGLQPEAGGRGQAEPDRSGEAAPGAAEAEPAPAAESSAEGLTLSAPAAPAVSQQARAPSQQGGLFAPPTRGEVLEGERRRRDAERNGETATGRTDMMAGDGELFAGPRPEQVDVEQAIAAEQAVSPSQGEKVEAAAAEAAASPENDRPEPTDAQREAGNYKKGALSLHGLRISIENPAGTRRRPEWPPLAHHYGYVRGTEGKDGDHVDVFIGPDAENATLPVFVVDQVTQAGRFDEHKVMLGFADEAAAREGYLANYSPDWQGLGDITQMTLAEFKAWVIDPARTSKRASADAQLLEAEAATMAEAPAPAPTAEDSAPAPIRDFGEKIGGARKDTAMPTGARGKSAREAEDERPTWAKRYEVSQVAASTLDPEETGRWMIRDKRTKDRMGQQKLVGERAGYATREEAEAALPLIELARNHRITMSSRADGEREFLIVRSVTDRKYVVLKNGFASRDEAMRYMVENAVELIETRTSFGEIDLPLPPSRQRQGAARRDRDVRDSDFSEVFGFRGVEFGNWNNQAERQELLNDAYDGLIDLSDVLGIPPRAISLGGELALAFGARGHGLSGARAHYEPTRPVINLTKENGAGSLAHEWMHALDHYLWRRGNPRVKWKTNDDGTRSLDLIGNDFDLNSMSGGTARDNVRAEIRELFQKLNVTMSRKAVEYVNDTAKVEAWVAKARDQVKSELDTLRGYLARPIDYAKRNNKPASADQLAAFDTLAEQILTGRDVTLRAESPPKARKGSYSTRWTNDAINGISSILKAVRGTEGFTSDGKGTMNRIASFVRYYGQRLDEMAKANEGETEVKAVPTDFKRAAKELDQGRTSDYWSLPSEMLARAFQGYVEDKIAERGGFSPFLNFGPEQAVIVSPWGFVAPFPRGAERKAINAVFDDLFQTLKVSDEGDGRVGLFSRPRLAASQEAPADQTQTPEFRRWFGDSKVVDAEGRPLVVYHGTRGDFDTFDAGRQGQSDFGASGRGFYFSQDPGSANLYANLSPGEGAPNIMPVYVALQNPYEMGALLPQDEAQSKLLTERLKDQGYDGIVVRGVDGVLDEAVAFRPEQIKSAIGNRGTFDPADPRITFSQPQPGDRIPMGALRSETAMRLAVAAALDSWAGQKPIVRVVRTAADLPADAKMGEGWQTAEGYFDGDGGVWLVTENLSDPQRALEVLRHEAVGHFGVERVAGAAWPSIVSGVEAMRGQKRTGMSKPMAASLAEAEARYEAAASDDPLLFAKELLAVMAETGTRAGFMDRMLSQLRAFLRKTGLIGEAFSEAELRNVLSGAFRLVERGGSLTAGAPVATGGMQSIRPDDVAAYILRMMGQSDADLFRYPKSDSKSFAKVVKEVSENAITAVKLGEVDANFTENLDDLLPAVKWGLRLPDGSQAFVYIEQPSPYQLSSGLRMFIDASAGNSGASLGSAAYAALFQWALNTGHVFIGDPNGLSTEALLRRTEHMLSAALKHGTTRMMAPHDRQVDPMDKKWGPSQDWAHPLQWTDGDDVGNITALIRTSVENHRALLKGTEADGAVYRLSDGQFLGAGGQPLTDEGLRRAAATAGARFRASGRFAGPESRAAAVGGSTVARTLVLRSLLEGSQGTTAQRRALLADLAERLSSQRLTYDRARRVFYSRPRDTESSEPDPAGNAVTEAQQDMLRGMAQGQPLDRMFRLPFAIAGAVDEQGRLAKGVKLTDAVRDVLLNWTPNPAGSFGWMNPMIERARAGLIDRYKLSDEYQIRDRERIAQERVISKRGGDIVKALTEAGVGLQESKVLQAVLNGEQIEEGDYAKLAAPIREAITELGREAVQLGLISAEAFERNKLSYLHRSYAKYEAEIEGSAIKRWVDNALSSSRRKISGNSFKGRGMDKRVTMADLVRSAPADWWGRRMEKGQADKQLKGREFLIFDRLAPKGEGTETAPGIEPGGRPDRVLERHYWPADVAVPAKYEAWENRGKWEVRGVSGDQVTLWRDFTKAERERMGEIVDARYNIAKTFHLLAHDLATARFFDDIARNPEWSAKTMPTDGVIVDASEASRLRTWAGVDWVKVPDVTIPRSQAKKYGALSGRWVRAEIWRDLQELDRMHNPSSWEWVLTQWKLNKTARSPVVHMNNVMSNLVLMDMADVRLQDLVRGFQSFVKQDADYQDAMNYGAFGGSMVAAEFRRDVLQPLLAEILAENRNAGGGLDGKVKILSKLLDGLHAAWKTYDNAMTSAYQAEDEIFRMATFLRRRSLGDSPQVAATTALEQFLNYDIRAPWINALRRTVMPFVSYTYRAVPVIAQSIAHRPWKLAKYATIAWLVNALGYMLAPGDEEEERRSMRSQDQGYTWVGVPRMIRMPWRDANDNPVFLDVRRWVPAGDVFDTNQGQTVLPIPAPLQFGGPLMLGAEFMLNKQAFTGKEIVNPLTDTLGDRLEKVGGWAYKSWMPSAAYIPGSWYWDAVGTAVSGGRDTLGRPYSVPQALASSVGIKARGHDIDFGFQMHELNYERTMRALKFERKILGSDLERGLISERAFEAEMRRIEQKMDRLDANMARVYGEDDE